jgi:hypothetical protein
MYDNMRLQFRSHLEAFQNVKGDPQAKSAKCDTCSVEVRAMAKRLKGIPNTLPRLDRLIDVVRALETRREVVKTCKL